LSWIVVLMSLSFFAACSGDAEQSLTAEEVMERGERCCTVDGRLEDPVKCEVRPGATYLEDFSHVDSSGHGEACGWVLNR
jgi:hypothetical protein